MIELRDLVPADYEAATALNNAAVPHVNAVDVAELGALDRRSVHTAVAVAGDDLAGLLIVLGTGCDYESLNYRWFSDRVVDFWYVDRIVVHPAFRGAGIGRSFYDRLEAEARRAGVPRICLEVNVEPPNPASLAFHVARGYEPLDRLQHPDGHVVELMALDLASG